MFILITFVDSLVKLSFLDFVETTTIITRTSLRRSFGEKQTISPVDQVLSQGNDIVLKEPSGGIILRTKRRLSTTSLYGSKSKVSSLNKRLKKDSDSQNTIGFSKRDFFFAPAPPYEQMSRPVDRRMFLVHRGERGSS